MPLIKGCSGSNPIREEGGGGGANEPGAPDETQAVNSNPGQGDHVFGTVASTIETALQRIFRAGQGWEVRMGKYDTTMKMSWNELESLDLGHSADPPVANRTGVEIDEHNVVFGGYSRRLQWKLCEIVCIENNNGTWKYRVGGYTRQWEADVLLRLDDVLEHLVDSTALRDYLHKQGAKRKLDQGEVGRRHAAVSLTTAEEITNAFTGGNVKATEKSRIVEICGGNNMGRVRNILRTILQRFESGGAKTIDND